MVGIVDEWLSGRRLVIDAINELLTELDNGTGWENDTLPTFLEAVSYLLDVIESSYTNTGREVPSDPWELMAETLRGARYYE